VNITYSWYFYSFFITKTGSAFFTAAFGTRVSLYSPYILLYLLPQVQFFMYNQKELKDPFGQA